MANVTFDVHFQKGSTAQGSPFSYVSGAGTVPGTIGSGTNRALIVLVGLQTTIAAAGTVAVTWDQGGTNQAMTLIGSKDTPGGFSVHIFGLRSPTSGSKTIQVTYTGTLSVSLGGVAVTNADPVTTWRNFTSGSGTSTDTTISVASQSGNMVIGGRADDDSATASIANGTQDWDERTLSGNYGGVRNPSVGASASIGWTITSDGWASVGVDVISETNATRSWLFGAH